MVGTVRQRLFCGVILYKNLNVSQDRLGTYMRIVEQEMFSQGAREGAKPTTMANWNRYETTDPTLHGPWKLADTSFAAKANGQPIGTADTFFFSPFNLKYDLKSEYLPRQARDTT
jgi:hypothetical protein